LSSSIDNPARPDASQPDDFEAVEDKTEPTESAAAAPGPKPRYRSFGTLRFVLALMVTIGHAVYLGPDSLMAAVNPYRLGAVGVMTFFVLSGFVIAEANSSFYANRPGSFLVNRALRILPPYYAALIVSLLLHILMFAHPIQFFLDSPNPPASIFDVHNVVGNFINIVVFRGLNFLGLSPDYKFVRFLWALVVELQFYVYYALVFYVATRAGANLRRYVLPAAFVGFTLLHLAATRLGISLIEDFQFFPYFALGMGLYYLWEQRNKWAAAGIAVSALLAVPHYLHYIQKDIAALQSVSATLTVSVAGSLALLLLSCLAVAILCRVSAPPGFKNIDRVLGDLTYSLYLNHFVILIVMLTYFGRGNYGLFVGGVLLAIVFAHAMNFLTEPFTRGLRDKVRGARLG
jgi:peptidoglycan/LPS O-acetylase OafA/YrhL